MVTSTCNRRPLKCSVSRIKFISLSVLRLTSSSDAAMKELRLWLTMTMYVRGFLHSRAIQIYIYLLTYYVFDAVSAFNAKWTLSIHALRQTYVADTMRRLPSQFHWQTPDSNWRTAAQTVVRDDIKRFRTSCVRHTSFYQSIIQSV